jgi:formylglycine-generating enzyme required for sulfatase activity
MTFKTEGGNVATITLVPTADCPNMFNLDSAPAANALSIPASSSRIIALTIKADQVSQSLRLGWDRLAASPGIKLWDSAGTEISASPISGGKDGAVFVPRAAGLVYATVSNAGGSPLVLQNVWLKANFVAVTVSLGDPLSRKVVFSAANQTVVSGTTLVITNANANPASAVGWIWAVNGVTDSAQTGPAFTWATAGRELGNYVISVCVTSDGILYSGNLAATIAVAAGSAACVVTYGSLARAGYAFGGWTLNPDGSGTVYGPAAGQTPIIATSANRLLYPKWVVDMPMVLVPGGSYRRNLLGSNFTTVSSFYMGRFEVTQAKYVKVMGLANPSSFPGENHENYPVEQVSFYDALVFCNKLSLADGLAPVYTINGSTDPGVWGRVPTSAPDPVWDAVTADFNASGYRLPTEAENTWAAMGGMKDALASDISGGINHYGNTKGYAGSVEASGAQANAAAYAWFGQGSTGTTHPVGGKLPNELGIYDLSGNVYEWCWDWAVSTIPSGTLIDWTGGPIGELTASPSTANARVFRGGTCFENLPASIGNRAAYTGADLRSPGLRNAAVGFRVVRSASGNRYLPREGLVGEWLFSASQADTAGNANDGSRDTTGGTVSDSTDRFGYSQGSLVFGGGCVRLPNPPLPAGTATPNEFSISLWVKSSWGSTHSYMLYLLAPSGVGSRANLDLAVSNDRKVSLNVWPNTSGNSGLLTTEQLPYDQWVHLVATRHGAQRCIYINGRLSAQDNLGPYYNGGDVINRYWIGRNGDIDANWDFLGDIDDVRIYNRPLGLAEVQRLYQEIK